MSWQVLRLPAPAMERPQQIQVCEGRAFEVFGVFADMPRVIHRLMSVERGSDD